MSIATKELRERAVAAYKTGRYSQRQLADVYGVHSKTIANWIRIERMEQRVIPLPRGHNPEIFSEEDKSCLIRLTKENPHLTLAQIREHMGKNCSLQTVHNALRRLGIRLKRRNKSAVSKEAKSIAPKTAKLAAPKEARPMGKSREAEQAESGAPA